MCGAERLAAAEPRGVSRRGRRVLCDRYRNLIPAPNWTPSHILKGGHKVTAVACSAGPAPRTAPRALPARRLLSFLPREPRPALPARLPASPPSPETALSMTRATECCRPSNNGAANRLRHRTQWASLRCSRRPSARRTGRGEAAGHAHSWLPRRRVPGLRKQGHVLAPPLGLGALTALTPQPE